MPTGVGMIESSDYNRGTPYFVEFRPILHSPFKIIDKELNKHLENIKNVVLSEPSKEKNIPKNKKR